MKRNIEVVSYDLKWPELFEKEAELIKKSLGSNCIEIHHIGSTSVPGLKSKPIIDMMPVVRNVLEVDKATKEMESLGYEAKGEAGMAFRRFFLKSVDDVRTHNVHVYEEGDSEIDRYLKFRNWMRTHNEDAKNYANLKTDLAAKYPEDILQYCMGKDAFVATIDAKDGYQGFRMVKALTDREWVAVCAFRKEYFFEVSDPYAESFIHKDHVHFAFYKNAEVIGYAHLHLLSDGCALLRLIAIDKRYRNLGFGKQLLKLCERWLSHQGFKKLLIHSSEVVCPFYLSNGYVRMSFNDPERGKKNPLNIEIGKNLPVNG